MTDIIIARANMKRSSRVECKYVVLVSEMTAVGEIRDAVNAASERRKHPFSDGDILMSSVQLCSGEVHPDMVAVVIIAKTVASDFREVTDEMEEEDKEFLSHIAEVLGGINAKIYYTVKTNC